jgi:AcrR family transcriptional regulator
VASPARTRKRNPRGEGDRLRAALMEATVELLLEHGNPDGLSIRNVTARAGVSPTALYLHFADKDELLRAVCDEAFEDLGAFLAEAAASRADDPRAQIEAMGDAYMAFARQRPALYRILFAMPGRTPGLPRPLEENPGRRALQALIDVTALCLDDGRDPGAVAMQLWTALHGFVTLRSVPDLERGLDWPSDEAFLQALYCAHLDP